MKTGIVNWGHARSNDLIHWETLPIAIKPYEKGDIFSGCCDIDKNRVSRIIPNFVNYRDESKVPLIAIYTLHKNELQTQALANII